MAAIAAGDEVQLLAFGGVQRRLDRRAARQGNGRGRQARARVRIVGGVGGQVAFVDIACVRGTMP